MKTIMAKTPHDSSFSSSMRHFHWRRRKEEDEEPLAVNPKSFSFDDFCSEGQEDKLQHVIMDVRGDHDNISKKTKQQQEQLGSECAQVLPVTSKKKTAMAPVLRLMLTALGGKHGGSALGSKVVGTLFGNRRGHVYLAFQEDPKASPALLIELATPTSGLVREMASGLVRVALECDRRKGGPKLIEEPLWRTYCNGRKCGFAMRRECGAGEWKVLRAVEPISMGAGVLPGSGGAEGEVMYMRARFERVVGSRDSEAYYMMNPDGTGGPELSIYLLRV